jgi:Thioredoxin/Trypsin-like peptidase domain
MLTATLFLALFAAPGFAGENAPLLLDFNSESCGPCQQMRPAIEELIRKGYPVQSIDVGKYPQKAAKYRVEHVPTFIVVDSEGRQLDRVEGARPAIELANRYRTARAKLRENDAEAAPSRQPAVPPSDDEPVEQSASKPPKPWETVVRICIPDGNYVGFGSGTIIYSTDEESIILTCAHIFKLNGRKQVTASQFPHRITVDLHDGKIQSRKPAVVQRTESFPGQAVDYDFSSDVGLIRIRPGKRLPASPVVPPTWKPAKSLEMIAVGCAEGKPATAWTTYIHRAEAPFLDPSGKPYSSIECTTAPIQGRSGGGLYTTDGYVAGVCDFADYGKNLGLYASPKSIHKLLDRNNLRVCYESDSRPNRQGALLASNRTGAKNPGDATEPPRYRSQGPDESISLPSHEMLGIKDPSSRSARSEAPGSSLAWQASGKGRVALIQGESRQTVRTRLQNSSPSDDSFDRDSTAGDLDQLSSESSPRRDSASRFEDPFDADPPAPAPAPKRIQSKTNGMWRPAGKSNTSRSDLP